MRSRRTARPFLSSCKAVNARGSVANAQWLGFFNSPPQKKKRRKKLLGGAANRCSLRVWRKAFHICSVSIHEQSTVPWLYLMVLSNNRPVQPAGEIHKDHLPSNKVALRNKFDSKSFSLGGGRVWQSVWTRLWVLLKLNPRRQRRAGPRGGPTESQNNVTPEHLCVNIGLPPPPYSFRKCVQEVFCWSVLSAGWKHQPWTGPSAELVRWPFQHPFPPVLRSPRRHQPHLSIHPQLPT